VFVVAVAVVGGAGLVFSAFRFMLLLLLLA